MGPREVSGGSVPVAAGGGSGSGDGTGSRSTARDGCAAAAGGADDAGVGACIARANPGAKNRSAAATTFFACIRFPRLDLLLCRRIVPLPEVYGQLRQPGR